MVKTLEDYQKEAQDLGIKTEGLTTVEALKKAISAKKAEAEASNKTTAAKAEKSLDEQIAEAEANLEDLKKQKVAEDNAARLAARAEADKNDKRPKYKHSNGLTYRFKKDCPKTLNFDGAPQKLSDIIKDEKVMTELVAGRSNFIELVN